MKFSYTALSNDNQKLTGVLEADSLEIAQTQLHKINLSIISIEQISDKEFIERKHAEVQKRQQEGVRTYSFVAQDALNKEISGTIDAPEPYIAYKRLVGEYHFRVSGLYPFTATSTHENLLDGKKLEWNDRLRAEGIQEIRGSARVKSGIDEEGVQVDKVVVAEIDNFIINTKKVLAEHKDQFSIPFLKQIEKTLSELERVRISNNLKHIGEICNQLYELISHPDRVPMEIVEQNADAMYQGILNAMRTSALVQKKGYVTTSTLDSPSPNKNLFKKFIKSLFSSFKKNDEEEPPSQPHSHTPFEKQNVPFWKNERLFADDAISLPNIIRKFIFWLWSPNAILRKARKQELNRIYQAWLREKKARQERKLQQEQASMEMYASFSQELNSFVGWLLFFYILYFFIVDFAIEKEVGLPRDFAIKTIQSPLILNITIFLLLFHLMLKIKIRYFKKNLPASAFLFFFVFGLYTLLIINY